jgi:integrase
MANVTFVLKKKNKDSDKETPVQCYIRWDNRRLKYYTREKIQSKYWEDRKESKKYRRAKAAMTGAPEFNLRLDNFGATVKEVFRKYQNDHNHASPTKHELRELLDKRFRRKTAAPATFVHYFEEFISQSKTGLRINPVNGKPITKNTIKTYVTTYKHLLAFEAATRRTINFSDITAQFHANYNAYLLKDLKLSTNAIAKEWQIIKLVLNDATDRGANTNLAYKGKAFTITREKPDNIYLTWAEIEEIEKLDLSKEKRLEAVRDLFLVGCCTGLRFSDWPNITPEKIIDDKIHITQTKTGHPVVIPLHEIAEKILTKYHYILPRVISNQKANQYLKEIGSRIGGLQKKTSKTMTKGGMATVKTLEKWERITTHTARRSFATNLYLEDEVSTLAIMHITGHKTEKAFMKYILAASPEYANVVDIAWKRKKESKGMVVAL